MSQSSTHHVVTTKPAGRPAAAVAVATKAIQLPAMTTASRKAHDTFSDYIAQDTFRRETARREEDAQRIWRAKYDPWLVHAYQEMYDTISHNRGMPPQTRAISLKRPEWQQPADVLPPVHKRLHGQRRRRILGSFPETENDKIGWRLLPQHAIDIYGSATAHIPPLPKQYKLSSYPPESFY